MNFQPHIVFTHSLPPDGRSRSLSIGTLEIHTAEHRANTFPAVSGAPGHQHTHHIVNKSPLPPSALTKDPYELILNPIRSRKSGIAGWLFPILPFVVNFKRDPSGLGKGFLETRGNFALHFDRGSPGTGGCIGPIEESDWPTILTLLMSLGESYLRLPLTVYYAKATA